MSCAASFQSHDTTAIANISGRLDAESAADLAAVLQKLRAAGKPRVVANLASASSLDRVCLLRLLQESRFLTSLDQRLFLIAPRWLAEKPGTVLSTLLAQGLHVFLEPEAAASELKLPLELMTISSPIEPGAALPDLALLQDLQEAIDFWKDTILRGSADSPRPESEEASDESTGGEPDESLIRKLKDGLRYWLEKITGRH